MSTLEHRLTQSGLLLFVVAYLDQGGAGRSFDPKAEVGRLAIAQHLADLDIVVDSRRRDFRCERVILAGHSWGSTLGLLYRLHAPDPHDPLAAPSLRRPAVAVGARSGLAASAFRSDSARARSLNSSIAPEGAARPAR